MAAGRSRGLESLGASAGRTGVPFLGARIASPSMRAKGGQHRKLPRSGLGSGHKVEPLGEVKLKGIRRSLAAYNVMAP